MCTIEKCIHYGLSGHHIHSHLSLRFWFFVDRLAGRQTDISCKNLCNYFANNGIVLQTKPCHQITHSHLCQDDNDTTTTATTIPPHLMQKEKRIKIIKFYLLVAKNKKPPHQDISTCVMSGFLGPYACLPCPSFIPFLACVLFVSF